jgi:urease accessory protein
MSALRKLSFMKKNPSRPLIALSLLLLPNLASAHILPGSSHGLQAGLLHPLTGWDHLLAMFAVGMWAAQQRGRALWQIPLAFISVMILGGVLGVTGVYLPGSEWLIAASVLVLGGLIATTTRFTPTLSMMVVGLFALFHGFAHGHEMPAAVSALSFSIGFVISTAALHALGIGVGLALQHQPRVTRLAGAVIAAASLCFFVR